MLCLSSGAQHAPLQAQHLAKRFPESQFIHQALATSLSVGSNFVAVRLQTSILAAPLEALLHRRVQGTFLV